MSNSYTRYKKITSCRYKPYCANSEREEQLHTHLNMEGQHHTLPPNISNGASGVELGDNGTYSLVNNCPEAYGALGINNLTSNISHVSDNNLTKNMYGNLNVDSDDKKTSNSINIADVNNIFNALKIPDAVKDLPQFNGNPRLLYEFINNVEEILDLMGAINNTPYARIIMRAIRNKVTGQANEVLNMFGTPLDWNQIKTNLILHYSDKRNETSLIRDLHSLRQFSDTVEKFYSKIVEIMSTLNNHLRIHESDPNVILAKSGLYSEMCLNTFLIGLKEPLGSTVRAMKPSNIQEAFNFCIKEQNSYYMQYTEYNIRPFRSPYVQQTNQNPYTFSPSTSSFGQRPNIFNSRGAMLHAVPNNNALGPNNYSQLRQNQSVAHPNNNRFPPIPNQNQNVFVPRPLNQPQPCPIPMDIPSGNTRNTTKTQISNSGGLTSYNRQNNITLNNNSTTPNRNYSIREVHNIHSNPTELQYPKSSHANFNPEPCYYSELDQFLPAENHGFAEGSSNIYDEGSCEIDDRNFQLVASDSKLDLLM